MASTFQFGFMRPENAISLPDMRMWQSRAVDAIRQAILEGHRRIVVQSPTGSGKTLLTAHLFAGSIAKGKRPIFTVPDISLVNQTLKSFERVGIRDVGVMQAAHDRTDAEAQVQIASVQTLVRRTLPDVDLIVVDECHVSYKALYRIMDGAVWADKIVIGLSATPWARGMGFHWTKLIIGATIGELIKDGILCGFRVYAPNQEADLSHVRIVKGEFDEEQSSAVMRDAKIVADVVETWKQRWGKDRTFMFCVNRAHAKEQQAKFEQAGIPFGYIDGTMSVEEREPIFAKFRTGEIKGIASVGCLSRGVDEDVRCIIDAKPKNSEMAFVQEIGRGLRNPTGDKELLILDHAGNTIRLGMVTDIHHESLDKRAPGDRTKPFANDTKKRKPFKCPHCNVIIPYGRTRCPICHAVLKVASKVRHADGELIEFRSGKKKPVLEDKQAWYSGFLAIAQERGYSDGWAAWRYKSRFGTWPRGVERVPRKPTPEMVKYDRHLRIRYIKGREKEQAVNA